MNDSDTFSLASFVSSSTAAAAQLTFSSPSNSSSSPLSSLSPNASHPFAQFSQPAQPSHFNVPIALSLGLVASFIQSLGLTIQRKSHLQNERLPFHLRKPDYARPVWLIGFTVYFTFNILGSIFQIGTLPLIILGPLGAVSLLWNAILARILLGDVFSRHLVLGTLLIGAGALLIGLFGVLPDQTSHDLAQLIYLYSRPPFIIEMVLLLLVFSLVCSVAHIYEHRLNQTLETISLFTFSSPPSPPLTPPSRTYIQDGRELDEQDGIGLPAQLHESLLVTPQRKQADRRPSSRASAVRARSLSSPAEPAFPHSLPLGHRPIDIIDAHIPLTPPLSQPGLFDDRPRSLSKHERPDCDALPSPQKIAQHKLLIGIAFGATSGTLSGICLLFAKTGVELLIRSLSGAGNEFGRPESWLIVAFLVVCALLQLWYLNKALRLVNPTLICPLAFCFYNLSSIISGLVYYDQVRLLSGAQVGLISLGTAVLLGGVWVVSIGASGKGGEATGVEACARPSEEEATPLLASVDRIDTHVGALGERGQPGSSIPAFRRRRTGHDRRLSLPFDQLLRQFMAEGDISPARGFSIGLGAASPGFAIRPRRRVREASDQDCRRSKAVRSWSKQTRRGSSDSQLSEGLSGASSDTEEEEQRLVRYASGSPCAGAGRVDGEAEERFGVQDQDDDAEFFAGSDGHDEQQAERRMMKTRRRMN